MTGTECQKATKSRWDRWIARASNIAAESKAAWDDLTTKGGLDRPMHAVDEAQSVSPGRLLLWAAIPCIGGCLWQRLNRRYPRARARIEQHRVVWRRLWDNFVWVAEKSMLLGVVVVIEWPQQCDYWEEKCVIHFLERHRFARTHVHGCAYGLVSQFGANKGMPVDGHKRVINA